MSNSQHEIIFQNALVSQNHRAILGVANVFEEMGEYYKSQMLLERIYGPSANTFGAMARGTPITGTNGAVIPPGRYWQDIIGDPAKKAWADWTKNKPEVKVESTEDHVDEKRIFAIFTIPSTASNYGMPGVFWPTQLLGFPTIADKTVTSSQDTVQRPPPMTSMDVVKDIAQGTGEVAKSLGTGLGFTPGKLALIGGAALIALALIAKIMMPRI